LELAASIKLPLSSTKNPAASPPNTPSTVANPGSLPKWTVPAGNREQLNQRKAASDIKFGDLMGYIYEHDLWD
jgi:hypothetical protein